MKTLTEEQKNKRYPSHTEMESIEQSRAAKKVAKKYRQLQDISINPNQSVIERWRFEAECIRSIYGIDLEKHSRVWKRIMGAMKLDGMVIAVHGKPYGHATPFSEITRLRMATAEIEPPKAPEQLQGRDYEVSMEEGYEPIRSRQEEDGLFRAAARETALRLEKEGLERQLKDLRAELQDKRRYGTGAGKLQKQESRDGTRDEKDDD